MILNIEVNLTEFYAENFEYDSDLGANPTHSLSDEVAAVVKHEVKSAIREEVSADVQRLASEAYHEFGEEKIKTIVDVVFDEFIAKGEVKENSYSDKLVPVSQKMRDAFDNGNNWNSPEAKMKKMGENFADECRKRYDLSFASNIVTGLEKQGLLKSGVFEALTSDKDA